MIGSERRLSWHTGRVEPPLASRSVRRPEGGRRGEILDTAAQLFASAGYVGTSLRDVADACGIQAGSLYHHFESKEAIAVELIERYHAELDEIGHAVDTASLTRAELLPHTYALGIEIAACALRHRAALQLSLYEPHAGASPELVKLAATRPDAVTGAMRALLDAGQAAGQIKARIDRSVLAEQLCETMLHIGLSNLHKESAADRVATALCDILFHGIAARTQTDTGLDRSPAMRAAKQAVRAWSETEDADDRIGRFRAVARAEFARRGYEATTVRDIAAAAGVAPASVYRFIRSKKELLDSILDAFHAGLSAAYRDVIATESTMIEKLDALTWINLNALERFDKEFVIQRAWVRLSPPDSTAPLRALRERARQIRNVIEQGRKAGEIRTDEVPLERLAACVRDLIWMPATVVDRVGMRAALTHSRATLLRGAATVR